MVANRPLEACIVRFRDLSGTVQGAGFLISDDLICTCAHVIAATLGRPYDDAPTGNIQISFDFPFLDSAPATATIEHWTPELDGDIAVLRLASPLPAGAHKAQLLNSALPGREIELQGYPVGNDDGAWAYGRIGQRRSNRTIQLDGEQVAGYAIQPGFSGTPVWDQTALGVVGMVVAAERDSSTRVGVMVPITLIGERYPPVAVAAARPVQSLGDGLAGLPNSPLDSLEHFIEEYLGTPEAPVPFGGRAAAFNELDRWLADPIRPFGLLVAEAGRGKSALVVRWVAEIAQRDRASIALVPVSIRFGTATRTACFTMLGARLRHLSQETGDSPADPGTWLGEISIRLRQDRVDQEPLLVVLDGADEATDWMIGRDLRFPAKVGTGVKILVSARAVAGRGSAEWARLLNWSNVQVIPLPLLSLTGVTQALNSMGGWVSAIADQADITAEISRLSTGDPLLVRMWAESLRDAHASGDSPVTAAGLARREPGLHGFFNEWWHDQEEQWRLQGRDATDHQAQVLEFFYLCARALGPVSREEVAELGEGKWSSPQIAAITKTAERFVIGDGTRQGWVFSHPRLGQYFSDERMVDADRSEWEQRFIQLGYRTLQGLLAGRSIRQDSTYGLRNYASHLERSHQEAKETPGHYQEGTCDCAELLHEIVTPAWQRAREEIDGTNDGFLSDAQKAWGLAEAEGRQILNSKKATKPGRRAVNRQVRCALINSSIRSLVGQVPPSMVSALVDKRVWTAPQALAHIRGLPDDPRGAALVALAPYAPDLHHEIVSMARVIADPVVRLQAMLKLADTPAASDRASLIVEVQSELKLALSASQYWGIMPAVIEAIPEEISSYIRSARTIADPLWRVRALESIAERLQGPARAEILAEALTSGRSVEDPESRMQVLEGIATLMAGPAQAEVLREAVSVATSLSPTQLASVPLTMLAITPTELRQAISQAMLDVAISSKDSTERAWALRDLASSLPEQERGPAQTAFVTAAMEIEDGTSRASAVNIGVEAMPESLALAALEVLRSIGQDSEDPTTAISDLATRARSLAEFATILPKPARHEIAAEALATARTIKDGYWRGVALVDIAGNMPDSLVTETVEAADTLEDKAVRLNVLSRLAHYRQEIGAASIAAEVLAELPARTAIEALAELVPHLTADALILNLATAESINIEDFSLNGVFTSGVSRILALSGEVSADIWKELLSLAGRIAVKIDNEYGYRSATLEKLAPYLHEQALRSLLDATREIRDHIPQARAITHLVPYISASKRQQAISDVIRLIRRAPASYKVAMVLHDLIPYASSQEALAAAELTVRGKFSSEVPYLSRRLAALGDLNPALKLGETFDAPTRLRALAMISDGSATLDPSLWEDALSALSEVPPDGRARILLEVGATQPQPLRDRLISAAEAAARDIDDLFSQIETMAAIVPLLGLADPAARLSELAVASARLQPGRERARALVAIGTNMVGPERYSVLSEALQQTNHIHFGQIQSWTLQSMAAALPDSLLPKALAIAEGISDEQSRSSAIEYLAPHLPELLVWEAIASADSFSSDYWQSSALKHLLVRLAELGLPDEALARAGSITTEFIQAEFLGDVARHLSSDLLRSALDLTRDLRDGSTSYAMVGIICRQGELGDYSAALRNAPELDRTESRAAVLANLAGQFNDSTNPEIYEPWCDLLRALAERPRPDLLSDLAALAPLLANLGGEAAVADIAGLIANTGRWFP